MVVVLVGRIVVMAMDERRVVVIVAVVVRAVLELAERPTGVVVRDVIVIVGVHLRRMRVLLLLGLLADRSLSDI